MASELLDADKISKGKSKWTEDSKVYTRRFKRATATATAIATSPTALNNLQTLDTEHTNSQKQQISPATEVIKPVVNLCDGLVKINLQAAKSRNEIIELKKTMKSELEKVRTVAQKLEDKEAELISASSTVVANSGDYEPYNHSQHSGNNTVVRNPFKKLSISVMNNIHGVGEFVEKEKRTPKANQYYLNSDFLLGKDRLPTETNKRQKSNSGRKHIKESDYVMNQMFKNCNSLLQRLMKHKFGWVFNEPVNAKMLGLHDYHEVIEHPMDLGMVKSRLAQGFYKSPMEFADDVRLTFRNAMAYNPKGQDVHFMAEELSNIFEEKWAVIESQSQSQSKSNSNLRYGMIYDANTPTPTSKWTPHFAHEPSRMLYRLEPMVIRQNPVPARTRVPKKPKAKDPNKRVMTYEEKQKLSANLQSLPYEKLDSIVQIIKKNTPLSQHDEEIEVDIDSVDVETLWELDRLVTNYKKNLSKHRRKALLAQQARAVVGDVKTIAETPKETKTKEMEGDNASSSSSSSSDSGSSSSDSDSDSSSEDG